jgi:hypothetical protein
VFLAGECVPRHHVIASCPACNSSSRTQHTSQLVLLLPHTHRSQVPRQLHRNWGHAGGRVNLRGGADGGERPGTLAAVLWWLRAQRQQH